MIFFYNLLLFSFFYFIFVQFSRLINLYDYPDIDKIHKVKIPPIGGLIISATILSNIFLFELDSEIINLINIASLMIIIGVIDDKFNINPYSRLIYQVFCACLVVFFFLRIETLGYYYLLGDLKLNVYFLSIFSVLCIIGLTNAINFIDGIDGLASGLVIIALLQIIFFNYGFNFFNVELILIIFTLVLILFFIINLSNKLLIFNKIFLGNAGSIYIGFMLSLLLIYFGNKNINNYHQVMNLWVVAIPVYDFFATSINRLLNKQNPMQSDLMHIHHLLLKLGYKQKNISFLIILTALALGILGFIILNLFNALFSLVMFFIFFILYFNFKLLIIKKIK